MRVWLAITLLASRMADILDQLWHWSAANLI